MEKHEKIYIAGHRGLVGTALHKIFREAGYENFLLKSHTELDLTDTLAVNEFFDVNKPNYVLLAAAKVGGIHANNSIPADFIYQNLKIQNNVIEAARQNKVKRLLFLGSSCIYPRNCPQPMNESHLLSGALELTNRPYAIAKIAGIEMCWAYNRQYGTQFCAAMPTNLYGPNDNYDLNHSHVIPALIRKMHEAKIYNYRKVKLWGTGEPKREFLYSDDLARACLMIMTLSDEKFQSIFMSEKTPPILNVGYGSDLTIAELAKKIAKVVGFEGYLEFDSTMPDGTPRKLLDITNISALNWKAKIELDEGLSLAYKAFMSR